MPGYPREIEVDRLMNVATAFSWEKVKEEVIGTDLVITLKKTIFTPEEITEPTPS